MRKHTTEWRARDTIHNTRLVAAALKLGQTTMEIAQRYSVPYRTVLDYVKRLSDMDPEAREFEVADPKHRQDLLDDPEIGPCLLDSPAGFRAFFDRYAPYGDSKYPRLQRHSLEIVRAAATVAGWKDQVVINVPPRHAKSEVFSIWFAIWRFCMDRDTRVIILSKTWDLASDFTKYIANQLEFNELLLKDFGRFKPTEDEGQWTPGSGSLDIAGRKTAKERSLRARGSGQQIFGMAADWLISDDVVTLDNSNTPKGRDDLERWFLQEAMTRVEDEGHAIVIGTRFFADDLYGRLVNAKFFDSDDLEDEDDKLWEHIMFPALRDPLTAQASLAQDAIPLWREKWTRAKLMRKRATLGSRLFDATYQQNPLTEADTYFRREHLEACRDPGRAMGEACWPREQVVRVVHYDPGVEGYGVIFISDIPKPAEIFEMAPLDWVRRKGLGPEEAWKFLEQWQVEYGPINYFLPERNSWNWFDKHPVKEWCARKGIRIIKHHTGWNKISVELGWQSMDVEFEFGRINFPYNGEDARRKTTALIDELALIPHARYDDQMAALWLPKPHFKELYRMRHEPNPDAKPWGLPVHLIKGTWA